MMKLIPLYNSAPHFINQALRSFTGQSINRLKSITFTFPSDSYKLQFITVITIA